ncbi:MAG: CoA pyrophosphatase [Propionibacteriaceae bacterium]|jgi:8-oxo-dGTP pyrophosphatase MutT (NUDIX family)|nr:CoA pyrophosphatase [Propionibacteriaceae bacterium]
MTYPIPLEVVELGARLSRRPLAPQPGRRAAVLVLLAPPESAAETASNLVFIEKTRHLRFHAGQIAFPGGSIEPDDHGPVAAALREANEEAGIDPESVSVLGLLPEGAITHSGFAVSSVLGWWGDPGPLTVGDRGEIAATHVISVPDLLEPDHRLTWLHPRGMTGPGFRVGDLFIWGFTAKVLDTMFTLAGWARPWDPRRTEPIPERFLPPN